VVAGQGTCYAPTDAIIVLDGSGSVGFENWQKNLEFASNLGNNILALNLNNKVGVVEFSQVANEAISLTKDKDIFDYGIQVLNTTYQVNITNLFLVYNHGIQVLNITYQVNITGFLFIIMVFKC
jgi:hypothetical protein